ncbi:uncharacterized protein [Temnothorax longispinosus]|uniref:uncharacterized protein n=1 Tax=Temnothorax longispinosus TaxID=300112 RepID=UPI003A99ED9C
MTGEFYVQHLSEESKTDTMLVIDKEGPLKTPGLLWNSTEDCLQYEIQISNAQIITKRVLLSKIAQVFDPLGLIAPLLINGKIIMQRLWQQDLEWDRPVPKELLAEWEANIAPARVSEKFDVFEFCDASEKAFGACLYAVSVNGEGKVSSHLICSKSRVAPLKTISLPRLELEAALLLARLNETTRKSFGNSIGETTLSSDSTIVLGWIKLQPNKLKTFVINRVSRIEDLTEGIAWNHVPSEENPTDMLSRGVSADTLAVNRLWWHGPHWLMSNHRRSERLKKPEENLPKLKTATNVKDKRIKGHTEENFKVWKTQESYSLLFEIQSKLQWSQ